MAAFAALFMTVFPNIAEAARAVKADVSFDGKKTFFLVRLTEVTEQPRIFLMREPERVVIDLPDLSWEIPPSALPVTGDIKNVRFGKRDNGDGRIVLDLNHRVTVSEATVKPHPSVPAYGLLRIALTPTGKKKINLSKKTHIPASAVAKRPGETLIVIDPGHGGRDSGAISPGGLYEKNLVLMFSRDLSKEINRQPGMRSVLTRNSDILIPLEARAAIARKLEADVFISVHADSIKSGKVSGATIYSLSEKASDKEAAALALKENLADVIAGIETPPETRDVAEILIDLAQRETNGYSYTLAENLVAELRKVTPVNKKAHRQAGFIVLKSPDVPSVLIEAGYLTSAADVARLTNPKARANMARAVTKALVRWHKRRDLKQ